MPTQIDQPQFQDEILNHSQLSKFLGICPRSVRNFSARGLIPKIKLGRRILFRRQAVLQALAALEVGGAARR